MYCGDASTAGNQLTQRIESACGEPRDGNRWSAYRRAPSQVFLLRRAIVLLHAYVRQNVHPLTATTFGDWLSPRARAHYHKSQINTARSNDNSFLIRLRWNLGYSSKGSSQSSKGKVPVFFLLRHEAYHRLYFLTVARGPTMSQSDRLIWPPDHIQCIDERIVVAKQRVLETSNLSVTFSTQEQTYVIIGANGGVT